MVLANYFGRENGHTKFMWCAHFIRRTNELKNIYPMIKSSVGVFKEKNTKRIHFVFYSTSCHKVFEIENECILKSILLMDGTKPLLDIFLKINLNFQQFTYKELEECTELLLKEGIIENTNDPIREQFTTEELERYSRQVDLWSDYCDLSSPWELQKNIKESTVAIIGIGGIGSWMATSLVMAGIGNIKLVDYDRVERHNITRQLLYTTEDIGREKIKVMEMKLRSINPNVNIFPAHMEIDEGTDLSHIVESCDLVINCADNPDINTTAQWVSKVCLKYKVPHIVGGGYIGHLGLIGPTIIPGRTKCWDCYQINYKKRRKEGKLLTNLFPDRKRHTGATASISSIVANFQVWDAIRLLGRIGDPNIINKTGEIDLNNLSIRWNNLSEDDLCEVCSEYYI